MTQATATPNAADQRAAQRRRHRYTPSVSISVDLDEFDDDEIAEYLRGKGYYVDQWSGASSSDDDGLIISPGALSRLDTLLMCGQREHAVRELLDLVGEALGRPL